MTKGEVMEELSKLHCSPITANTPKLTAREISQLKTKLPGWVTHKKKDELRLEKSFLFKDFNQARLFTDRIANISEQEDHHPAILTEWGKVTVTWWTHKIKGLHKNDFIMAAKTEQLI
jgi:4a-hydroxytetrahydrobiopterin dehydratase